MRRAVLHSLPWILFSLTLVLSYNACQRPAWRTTENGTSVGNPMVSRSLLKSLCEAISRCHPEVSLETCQANLVNTPGFDVPLHLSSEYSTLTAVLNGEIRGDLVGNGTNSEMCTATVRQLSCSDPAMASAYNSSRPDPFAQAPAIVPPQACGKTFAPGINLEVPIEMVDHGLASSPSAATVFERTRTSLDPAAYDGTVTYTFEVVATNASGSALTVTIVNSAGAQAGLIEVPANTTSPLRLRSAMTPSTVSDTYRVRLSGSPSADDLQVFAARILVNQTGATKTRIFIPLTGHHSGATSRADDSSAAIDKAGWGGYSHNALFYYTLWKKDKAAYSQIPSGASYTFEAVISTSVAGSTTAYAALANFETGQVVAGSEVATTAATPTLVTASFSDAATNFTDLASFEMVGKNSGAGTDAYVYRSGLWIQLSNLLHAEIPYRTSLLNWGQNPSGDNLYGYQLLALDLGQFSAPLKIARDVTGFITGTDTPVCQEELHDIGVSDSATSGAAVASSAVSFSSLTKTLVRTPDLALVSGHRFVSNVKRNAGPGSCIILQPRIVVKF